MKIKQSTGLMVLAVGLVAVLAAPVAADHFIKQVTNTDAVEMMGQKQPATSDTSSIWLTDGKAAMTGGDGNVYIFVAGDNKLYAINHERKTYAVTFTKFSESTEDMTEEEAEQAAAMKAMASQMMGSMKVTVTPTDETKKIRDWNTSKYDVDMAAPMGNVKTQIWSTEDIKMDYDAFKAVANAAMSMMPGYDGILAEMKKIKGVAVYSVTEMSMMGATFRSSMEVLEMAEKDAPAGTYDIPEGYQKVEMMQMAPGQ